MITSAAGLNAYAAKPFNYALTGEQRARSFRARPAPGACVDPSTGLITGTPAATGTFQAQIGAANAAGAGVRGY